MVNSEKGEKMKINKKFMRKLAAVITAAAVVLPSYAIYADPDDSEEVTGSGLVDVIENQEDDTDIITDDNNVNGGTADDGGNDEDTAVDMQPNEDLPDDLYTDDVTNDDGYADIGYRRGNGNT